MWVYTLVAADYDGAALLPHFLEHYHGLKVQYSNMLVNIHHTPGRYNQTGLDLVIGVCASYGIECR